MTDRQITSEALHVVESWDDEDRQRFAYWVSGYAPNVVMRFELHRRQLPARDRIQEAR